MVRLHSNATLVLALCSLLASNGVSTSLMISPGGSTMIFITKAYFPGFFAGCHRYGDIPVLLKKR
jgi:hypothetical protein